MSTFTKNNTLIGAVIVLIIANIALLATIWFFHQREKHPPTPAEFLVQELKLNDSQKQQLHQLAKQHHEQAQKIQYEIKTARESFFSFIKNPAVTDSMKKVAADNVAMNLEQLDMLTFDHFKQVRAMLNPDQQKRFDEILQDVLRMVAAPQPNAGQPPPIHEGDNLPPPPPDR